MSRLAIALSTCMLLPSATVQALGMGDIDVQSGLNEKLSAQIELLSVKQDDLTTLEVKLASKDAYEKMGIDRSAILSQLRFEIVTKGAGAPFIKVSSGTAIREPFLDFVLNVSWSEGQVLREYTLLLDPPVFEAAVEPAAVTAAVTQPATIARAPATTTRRTAAPRIAPAGSYGPTARQDTLWTVAKEMRPNGSVSVPQMMVALLKENPKAFTNGNINNLKAGYILRAPQMDVVNALSKSAAADVTNQQFQEWQAARGKATSVARRQRVASPAIDAPMAAAPAVDSSSFEEQARLQLLTPEEIQQRSGVGSAIKGKASGTVQQQLAFALESAETSKQENADLRGRLVELEKQLQSVQRLIALKDDTLGAMQAGLGEQAQSAAEAEEKVVAAKPEPKKIVKKPVPPPAPVETSLIEDLMDDPILLGMAVGGPLLLILLLVSYLRKRRVAAGEDFMAAPLTSMPEAQSSADDVASTETDATAEEETDDGVGFGDFVSTNVDSIQAEESEIDPIAEADVYLAYRRYEQAEALLKEAIRADDGRGELKLKLLEIYFATKDKDSFEAQAEALYATLGGQENELWSQAAEMGLEICPDHPLFGDGATSAPSTDEAEGSGTAVDLDIEESQAVDAVPDILADEQGGADLSDTDLADSLGMSLGDAEDAGLDLDLSLGDELNLDLDAGVLAENLEPEALVEAADAEAVDLPVGDEAALEESSFDLDADLVEPADAEVDELAASLGDLEKEMDSLTPSLEMGDDVQPLAEPVAEESDTTPDWEIEPAVSSFETRDVKSEMDDNADLVSGNAVVPEDQDLVTDLEHLQVDDEVVPATEEDILAAGDGLSEFIAEADDLLEASVDDVLAAGDALGDVSVTEETEEEDSLFDASDDAVATKLDLAKAYIDMDDQDGARAILDEVAKEGDDSQREEAEQLKQQIS